MSDPFIAEIRIVPFTFAPVDWAFCDGQILQISQNPALFSLVGTTYGGDGKTNYALPNFMDRLPMGVGAGPGRSPRTYGQSGGEETVTLTSAHMPSHTHQLLASTRSGNRVDPTGMYLAGVRQGTAYRTAQNLTQLASGALQSAGVVVSSQADPNLQPYLVLGFIICLYGIYPART